MLICRISSSILLSDLPLEKIDHLTLTHQTPMLPSYRNQPTDLPCKSIDWFLYDGNFSVWWLNTSGMKRKKIHVILYALKSYDNAI